ncbi:MAG TPA: ABC transporter substrate-binding protein, partial [Verrucomicrobiae bacterium]
MGLFLIALAAFVLLASDFHSRKSNRAADAPAAQKIFKVAILQYSSQMTLEEGVKGMVDAMAEHGFVDGENLRIQHYNAEADLPTVNTIAKEITDGRFDLILTVSTPALQAVANANKTGKTKHVFGLVSDPYGTGVGINRTNHMDHPAWMAGFGTMQPVVHSFEIARQMRPELKSVGVIWNAAEANSLATVVVARQFCKDHGIELLEVTVDNSSGVFEAANSLVARGAEALWIGGDNTVLAAADS